MPTTAPTGYLHPHLQAGGGSRRRRRRRSRACPCCGGRAHGPPRRSRRRSGAGRGWQGRKRPHTGRRPPDRPWQSSGGGVGWLGFTGPENNVPFRAHFGLGAQGLTARDSALAAGPGPIERQSATLDNMVHGARNQLGLTSAAGQLSRGGLLGG